MEDADLVLTKLEELEGELRRHRDKMEARVRKTERKVQELRTHREHDAEAVKEIEDRLQGMHRAAWLMVLELGGGLLAYVWATVFGGFG